MLKIGAVINARLIGAQQQYNSDARINKSIAK